MTKNMFIQKRGISLVEVVITITIISGVLISLLQLSSFTLRTINLIEESNKANLIAQGTMEAARNFRDNTSWSINGVGVLTAGSIYHLEIANGASSTVWSMSLGSETDGVYSKEVIFNNVSRDPVTYDIEEVYDVANDDIDTKKVTVRVTWNSRQVEIENYLTNWQ